MAYDAHANLAYATIAAAPAPALSGTSLTVAAGKGALFPAAPFNVTIYPFGSAPLASNAEIARVTAVVGDTFTIVRAQEGTTAKPIAAGWQIANTASKLVFTTIENSIIQFISAGTTKAGASEVVFSNANGVTFGVNGQSITASVAGGGGAAISAGANSQNTGTIVFSNSNNVTFGLDGAGVLTASVPNTAAQSVQPVAFSAQGGSSLFSTLNFRNANGISFSNSGGSVEASYTVPSTAGLISAINFSAGAQSADLKSITFADGGGVSFGLNAGTLTASVAAVPGQSTQPVAASASNGSFLFSTLGFSNANNVTFGTSAGSIITASVGAGAQSTQPVAASASNGSFLFSTLGFSNANNVTFGTSAGSIITASIDTPSGVGAPLQFYEPRQAGINSMSSLMSSTVYLDPLILPAAISFTDHRLLCNFSPDGRSTNPGSSGAMTQGLFFAIYSRSVTDSGATNYSNSSNLVSFYSKAATYTAGWSGSSSSVSMSFGWQTDSTGGSDSYSISSLTAQLTNITRMSGNKAWIFPGGTSLSAGDYWFAHSQSGSNAGHTIASIALRFVAMHLTVGALNSWGSNIGVGSDASMIALPLWGIFSTSATGFPSSLCSTISNWRQNSLSYRYVAFNG